jgi:hypothetical protein
MPARDIFHDTVKQALIDEGWTITADPLLIRLAGLDLYVDLAAEKIVAAEKSGRKIAVEVKSFVGASLITEFHAALGQFVNYRLALQTQEPERVLYLAVPVEIYDDFFQLPFTRMVVEEERVKLIVYNAEQGVIEEWHE